MDSMNSKVRPFVFFCAIIASLGTLNSGFNTSALNIPGDNVRYCPNVAHGVQTYYPNSPLPQCLPMSDWIWGVATGMFAVGGLIGAMLAGPMSDKWGRRDAMIMINVSFFIGAILLSTSVHSAMFAIGRIFVGIGGGFMTVVISMYIAETAPPRSRGLLGSFLQLFMTIGILVIEAISLGLRSAVGWRVLTVITVVPAIAQMICLPFCPRSPRWLISQNRIDEARLELLRLRNGDIQEEFADMVLALSKGGGADRKKPADEAHQDRDSAAGFETKEADEPAGAEPFDAEVNLNFFQVMTIPVLARLTLKLFVVHCASQLTGINAIMYYSTSIFQDSFGDNAPYVTVGVAALNVLLTFVALGLVDRLGRKVLLLISAIGMTVFSVLMTIGLRFNVSPLQVVCIMLFVASFAVGLGIIPFILTAEVFPTYAVGAASSACLVVNWLCNFIIGLIFPTLQRACGPYVFIIFAGIAFLTAIFLLLFIPETKRKSIEEVGREVGWYGISLDTIKQKAEKKTII
ncbi:general substrate transporter [Radiomyces spectabilis]|uniref:general substrate transporter n=1 Tax=Radiomyces spectabilis TaxID=64574 RepID=UPI002221230A|nr:general substrate transporter [Radiomyces spectabilis]KAI8381080.1 general substrate transporter [Radiomyces spectabilis]